MKRFLFLCMWGLGMNVSGQSSFQIDHGPYLQEMRQDGVTVVFHTSKSSFSKLEVRKRGEGVSKYIPSFFYDNTPTFPSRGVVIT